MVGVEAGGRGPKLGEHAARFSGGSPGVLQGTYTYVLQDYRRIDCRHALGFCGSRLRRRRPGTRCPLPAGPRGVHARE